MFSGSLYIFPQITSDPVCTTFTHLPVRGDTGGHVQQIADCHSGKIGGNAIGKLVGKKGCDPVCQPQAVLGDGESDGGTDKSLGTGKHRVPILRGEGFGIYLRDHFSVTQHHYTVYIGLRQGHQRVHQSNQRSGRDPFGFGRRAFELTYLRTNRCRHQ